MKRTASDLSTIRTASNLSTILTLNRTVVFLSFNIAPLGITNTRTNAVRVICQQNVLREICRTIQFRLIFKGHKSLEYWCLVIHLTSVLLFNNNLENVQSTRT